MVIERPRFAGRFRVEVLAPDLVVVASENECRSLPGRLYPLMVPLIDGRNTIDDIIDGVAGRANALDVHAGLTWLERDGLIVDTRAAREPALPALERLRVPPRHAPRARLRVTVTTLGLFPLHAFCSALSSYGIDVDVRGAAAPAFGILLVDDYLRDEIALYDRYARQSGLTWLIARPSAVAPWIGPVFRPGVTPCWNCLALRLRENRPVHAFVARRRRQRLMPDSDGATDAQTAVALDLVAARVARWATGDEREPLEAGLFALEDDGRGFRRHHVSRLPHCTACGTPAAARERAPGAVHVGGDEPAVRRDGGYRTQRPEATVARLRPSISPLTGAIGHVERQGTGAVHVVVADHPFRFDREPRHVLRNGGRHKSAGKGLSASQAEASALCEAVERYSGVFRGDEPRRTARFDELAPDAVHPDRCLNFSARQYVERERWNTLGSRKLWVPRPFDASRAIEWSPTWSLTQETTRWLPTALCYYGYPQDAAHGLCPVDSNGNAAGNTIAEAILQGFFELVERDAVALWWYNRVSRPAVAHESFTEAGLADSVALHATLDRDVTVLDLTTDFGIPVFAALSRRRHDDEELLLGFGAHVDPDIALARAVTEMGQFLPAARRGRWRLPFTAPVDDDRFLHPHPDHAARTRRDYANARFARLGDCVAHCVAIAAGSGLETLVLDQTRADVGLPVVKVVVPGLRHFTARLGPGRLYDVPVALGWVEERLDEDDLNPSHIVI